MSKKTVAAELAVAAAVQYGLSRLLACAVTHGEELETREAEPHLPVPVPVQI